jgi:hypothetical protein
MNNTVLGILGFALLVGCAVPKKHVSNYEFNQMSPDAHLYLMVVGSASVHLDCGPETQLSARMGNQASNYKQISFDNILCAQTDEQQSLKSPVKINQPK